MVNSLRAVLVAAVATLAFAAQADASFPGANGKIVYQVGGGPSIVQTGVFLPGDIHVMNQDGSGDVNLGPGEFPGWSADGTRIAFDHGSLYAMNADGSNRHPITPAPSGGAFDIQPSWSPAGDKLAFIRETCQSADGSTNCFTSLRTINADGTGDVAIRTSGTQLYPAWAPDGSKIAFLSGACASVFFCDSAIATVNPDGTGYTEVLPTDAEGNGWGVVDWSPDSRKLVVSGWTVNRDGSNLTPINGPAGQNEHVWSPDGTKFAFVVRPEILTMNLDGSGATQLTTGHSGSNRAQSPDWQAVPYTGYARPRGASPSLIYLVPAYKACTAPNRMHGAPLSFPSCAPPSQASGTLTLGTADANGEPANGIAAVFFAARAGDMAITATISDVRRKSDLSDYAGQLRGISDLRITDRNNGGGSGTVQDVPLPFNITCTPTGDTTVGSACNVSTTVNALIPGAITAGQRSIWQLGQARAYDGGPDGTAATEADNTLFMTQGLFVP